MTNSRARLANPGSDGIHVVLALNRTHVRGNIARERTGLRRISYVTRNNNQWYIEKTQDGQFSAKKGGAQRASALEHTQGDAIARAKEIDPKAAIHVERVRHTDVGSPDKWRKP